MHFSIDRTVHTTAFDKPVVDHWLKRKIAQSAAGSTEKGSRSRVCCNIYNLLHMCNKHFKNKQINDQMINTHLSICKELPHASYFCSVRLFLFVFCTWRCWEILTTFPFACLLNFFSQTQMDMERQWVYFNIFNLCLFITWSVFYNLKY